MTTPVLEAQNVWRTYQRGGEIIHALADFSLAVEPGEMVGIVGRSGSGKTTFLNQAGCLDRPTRGTINIAGTEVSSPPEAELVGFRRDHVGFIFQLSYLLPTLTVAENVALPLLFARRRDPERVAELCERVGLDGTMHKLPGNLDGGDMQRVTIARALINQPRLLLADEPTGRLERRSRDAILGIFDELRQDGLAVVIATHDLEQADRCDRVVELRDGRPVQ
jgi:putative ABC transport system ATP-binding protein